MENENENKIKIVRTLLQITNIHFLTLDEFHAAAFISNSRNEKINTDEYEKSLRLRDSYIECLDTLANKDIDGFVYNFIDYLDSLYFLNNSLSCLLESIDNVKQEKRINPIVDKLLDEIDGVKGHLYGYIMGTFKISYDILDTEYVVNINQFTIGSI